VLPIIMHGMSIMHKWSHDSSCNFELRPFPPSKGSADADGISSLEIVINRIPTTTEGVSGSYPPFTVCVRGES